MDEGSICFRLVTKISTGHHATFNDKFADGADWGKLVVVIGVDNPHMAPRWATEVGWIAVNGERYSIDAVDTALRHSVRDDEVNNRSPALNIVLGEKLASKNESLETRHGLGVEHAGDGGCQETIVAIHAFDRARQVIGSLIF